MKQYHDYLKYILENGIKKDDRTGTGTISIFGYQMRFDLSKGFPLVTTKKLHFKSIAYELLWFLSGDTNIKFLNDNGVKIWNEWAVKETKLYDIWGFGSTTKISESIKKTTKTNDSLEEIENYIKNHSYKETKEYYNFYIPYDENSDDDYIIQEVGEIGGMYGKQWTKWEYLQPHSRTYLKKSINQISNVIEQIKNNPDSRRLIVSAWNVADLPDESLTPQENVKQGKMALAPCHYSFQFYVANNKLSCMFQMRSVDSFLGLPFNIASYSLLTHMIAQQCGLDVGDLIFTGGDCHIYLNHLEQVKEQLSRKPYDLPELKINRKPDSIFNYKYEDFEIVNYQVYPHIKGVVAV